MWRASRWTARLLLLVMLAPVFGPAAMACAAQPKAQHCMRQSMSASMSGQSVRPAMPCHHAMAQSKPPQSQSSPLESGTSFQATNDGNCCQNHCCCGATNSEWAQPASSLLSVLSLLIEPAQPSRSSELQSTDIFGHDSARAPPRS